MRFWTANEATAWLGHERLIQVDTSTNISHCSSTAPHKVLLDNLRDRDAGILSKRLARVIGPWRECLMWVVLSEVWPSSELPHLYYRLRQSYGDFRLLWEAPAHFFLEHEEADLSSFLLIAVLSGWEFCVLTDTDYVAAFVSHDEWLELYSSHEPTLNEAVSLLNA
jgi:hypothetical protein